VILMASVVEGEMAARSKTPSGSKADIFKSARQHTMKTIEPQVEDLVANPDEIAAKIAAFDQVKAATPRLYASGFLSSERNRGAKITGIDPLSPASDPYREGIISGQYLSPMIATLC